LLSFLLPFLPLATDVRCQPISVGPRRSLEHGTPCCGWFLVLAKYQNNFCSDFQLSVSIFFLGRSDE